MADWRIKLIGREEIADGTMAFHFEKPPKLEFAAGQFLDLTLIHPPEIDAAGVSRTLTIASAPFENELMFAMRMRDTAFKRVLRRLTPGDEVLIDDPVGVFTLHRDFSRSAAFLAGGIGITPFLSILRQVTHDKLSHLIYLFYSNRRPEDAAFLKELYALEGRNSTFTFIPIMTQLWQSQHNWNGEIGYLGTDLISRHLGSLTGPKYYIAGPPPMIESTRQKLLDHGVKRDDINADSFEGY